MVDPGQVSDTGLVHPNNTTYVLDTHTNKKDTALEFCTGDKPQEYSTPKSVKLISHHMYSILIQTKRTISTILINGKSTTIVPIHQSAK